MPERPDRVLLGEFGRAHGLRGEVRLKAFTARPEAVAGYGPLQAADGRAIVIEAVRPAPGPQPDMLIARVRGVASREAAEALNRVGVFATRTQLDATADEDEFLLADLIGLAVEDEAGLVLGTVAAMPNYGAGDLVEIRPAGGGPTALLPFTKAFVPVVDRAGGRLVVAAPDDLFAPARPADPDAA